jgi:hypothetical protein
MHHGASQNDAPPRDCWQGRRRRTFYSALVLSPDFPFSTISNRHFAQSETTFNSLITKADRVF